jgi:hypothetical protein
VVVAVVGLRALRVVWGAEALRCIGLFFAAGVVAAVPMFVYHWVAFGGPFTTGYRYKISYQEVVGSTRGMFSTPFWQGLYGNFIGSDDPHNRNVGLFARFPVLVFGLAGLCIGWRSADGRRLSMALCIGTAVWTLFFSKYAVYSGGASADSRFMTPAAVFLALGLGWFWDAADKMAQPWGKLLSVVAAGAAGISALNGVIDLANQFGHNWRMDRVDHVMLEGWPHLLAGSAPSWNYLLSNAFPNAGQVWWMLPLIVAAFGWSYWRWRREGMG